MLVFAGNLWFLYKETKWHKASNMPPSMPPQSTPDMQQQIWMLRSSTLQAIAHWMQFLILFRGGRRFWFIFRCFYSPCTCYSDLHIQTLLHRFVTFWIYAVIFLHVFLHQKLHCGTGYVGITVWPNHAQTKPRLSRHCGVYVLSLSVFRSRVYSRTCVYFCHRIVANIVFCADVRWHMICQC